MNKIIFVLAMLFCPSLYAATLTANTIPYVCQGGTAPQLCSSGNIYGIIPTGGIIAWYGNIASIPPGWTLCNGVSVERTDGTGKITPPDLRNSFIVGAQQDNGGVAMTNLTGSLTQSGSSVYPNLSLSTFANDLSGQINNGTFANGGYSFSGVNAPPYYALAYIMKT